MTADDEPAGGFSGPRVTVRLSGRGAGQHITTGAELRAARHALGWDYATLARALRWTAPPEKVRSRLHAIETGHGELTGPMAVAVEAFLAGFRPAGFSEAEPET